MPQNPAPPYYSELCQNYGLQQALIFPTDPELIFSLNPDDIQVENEDAGKSISIKYQSFIKDVSAVLPVFSISLFSVSREDLNVISQFAEDDFLNNVRTTGRGTLALYYKGEELTGLYIKPPIVAPQSAFKNYLVTPTEVFDSVQLKISSADPRWF
jgi:hypothetical protein